MKFDDLILEKIVLELRYKLGYAYLDKCGAILNELITRFPQLMIEGVNPQASALRAKGSGLTIDFNSDRILIVEDFIKKRNEFIDIASSAVNIISERIQVQSFTRVGNRFFFVHPYKTLKEANEQLKTWGFLHFDEKKYSKFGQTLQFKKAGFHLYLEDDNVGRSIRIQPLERTVDYELPPFIPSGKKVVPPPIILNFDIDIYTKKVVERGVLNTSDFLKSNYKMLRDNLIPFMEK
ncbi:MAG: hypothetical protein KKH94_08690 [Candidatus Omnitrophica bacterium]|nr:hypothetical protein [Candidatus Omnitrophota bacterium]